MSAMREVLVEALYYRIGYEDTNPEVGMGCSPKSYLDSILRRTGAKISVTDFNYIMNHPRIRSRR